MPKVTVFSSSLLVTVFAAAVVFLFYWFANTNILLSKRNAIADVSDTIVPARLAAMGKTIPQVMSCREQPFQVTPHLKYSGTVSDDDLAVLLCGAAPVWTSPPVGSLLHELKLWRASAAFTEEMLGHSVSGKLIVETLLSDKACRSNGSPNGGHYLLDSPYGIRVVELGGDDASENRGEGHIGQLLKALAEGGVPSTAAVTTETGRVGTIVDLFQDTTMRFSYGRELEFISCALAYWLPAGEKGWRNEFSNQFSFDQLMDHLLAIPYGKGACAGCHAPYAVVIILRLDEESHVLSPEMRKRALCWLALLSRELGRRQLDFGGWDRHWAGGAVSAVMWNNDLMDRITVTGHHLEWIALAPPESLPPREVVVRAVNALRNDAAEMSRIPRRSFKVMLPMSHAARALCLLRGVDAFSVFRDAWNAGQLKVIPTPSAQHSGSGS